MATFPGNKFSWTDLTDGVDYPISQHPNSLAAEIIAMQDLQGAGDSDAIGDAIVSNGGIRLSLAEGGNVVGYTGQRAWSAFASGDSPGQILPGGTGDVAVGLVYAGLVSPSSGEAQGGVSVILNGETQDIYNDGAGNQITIQVNSGGDVVLNHVAGTKTYDVVLNLLCWL